MLLRLLPGTRATKMARGVLYRDGLASPTMILAVTPTPRRAFRNNR